MIKVTEHVGSCNLTKRVFCVKDRQMVVRDVNERLEYSRIVFGINFTSQV